MNLLLYNIFLKLYPLGIRIASVWNNKAKLWIKGRKKFPAFNFTGEKTETIWMHCASLGEFEQGRPLIEKIRKDFPGYHIVITFFSPSGSVDTALEIRPRSRLRNMVSDSTGSSIDGP